MGIGGGTMARLMNVHYCAVLVGRRNPKGAVELIKYALEREPGNTRYQEALRYYEAQK